MPIQSINPANGNLAAPASLRSPSEALLREDRARRRSPSRPTPPCRSAIAPSACASSPPCSSRRPTNSPHSSPRRWASRSQQSRSEIVKCAAVCRYYADNAARILAPEPVDTGATDAYVRWDPLGVVLAVMPWNFPFWQVFRFLAPALMAGNVGLLKHASNVPQCALAIEALVRRAGFPRGTFQTLLIEASQVEMVLADERIAAVTLTGSESAGRAIAAQAGWLIKKSVLELGGSDPFIVMPSADLDAAVDNAVRARCVNSGQSCIAAKRFIVADAIYDAFESRFVAGMDAMKIGDPMPRRHRDRPARNRRAGRRTRSAGAGRSQGRRPRPHRRRAHGGRGQLLRAHRNCRRPARLRSLSRRDLRARRACSSASATSTRPSRSRTTHPSASAPRFGRAAMPNNSASPPSCNAAAVFLNALVASDPRLPFGGIKHSGYGRELSAAGMREFLNAKTVVIANPIVAEPAKPAPKLVEQPLDSGPATNAPVPFRSVLEDQLKRVK